MRKKDKENRNKMRVNALAKYMFHSFFFGMQMGCHHFIVFVKRIENPLLSIVRERGIDCGENS